MQYELKLIETQCWLCGLKINFSRYLSSLRRGTIAVIFLVGNLFTTNHFIKIPIFHQDKETLKFFDL